MYLRKEDGATKVVYDWDQENNSVQKSEVEEFFKRLSIQYHTLQGTLLLTCVSRLIRSYYESCIPDMGQSVL